MAEKKEKKPTGRPKREIDKKSFESLCQFLATKDEIATFFDCSDRTIDRFCNREYGEPFVAIYKKKSINGVMSLRRSQFKLAEKNATMSIWMGKQYLGQSDNPQQAISFEKVDRLLEEMSKEAKRKWN